MSYVPANRVMESSTTTGTGTYTLAGAVATFQTFAAVGDGNTCIYAAWAVDGSGNPTGTAWEVGVGTYTLSGTTLARTEIISSSTGSAISWGAGTKYIALSTDANLSIGQMTYPAQCRLTLSAGNPVYSPQPAAPTSGDTGAETLTFGLAHGWTTGTMVYSSATNAGLTADTLYYVHVVSSTSISLHTTLADAEADASRLNITSATPSLTLTPGGIQSTNLNLAQYGGDLLALHNGSRWVNYSVAAVAQLALGTVVPGQSYDVYAYPNSGTPTLELTAFATATVTMTIATPCVVTYTAHGLQTGQSITFTTSGALPTGVSANTQYWITRVDANSFNISTTVATCAAGTLIASSGSQSGTHTAHNPQRRATEPTLLNGVLVKTGATTRRLLGTITAISTAATEDSRGGVITNVGGKRHVANLYNEVDRSLAVFDSTATWTYGTATWRLANAVAGNRVEVTVCMPGRMIDTHLAATTLNATTTQGSTGIGLNSGTPHYLCYGRYGMVGVSSAFTGYMTTASTLKVAPAIGYNYLSWCETPGAAATVTFLGTSAAANVYFKGGLSGSIAA